MKIYFWLDTEYKSELRLSKGSLIKALERRGHNFKALNADRLATRAQSDPLLNALSSLVDPLDPRVHAVAMKKDFVYFMKIPALRLDAKQIVQALRNLYIGVDLSQNPERFILSYSDIQGVEEFSVLVDELGIINSCAWDVEIDFIFKKEELLYTSFLTQFPYEACGSLEPHREIDKSLLKAPTPELMARLEAEL